MVVCLERGADLHMARPMPLPLTVSCFSKIQIGFTFLVPADPGSPGRRTVKRVCVCVCVCVLLLLYCRAAATDRAHSGCREVPLDMRSDNRHLPTSGYRSTLLRSHTSLQQTTIIAASELTGNDSKGKKVKFSHTRYRALGPELIPVYRQSARR